LTSIQKESFGHFFLFTFFCAIIFATVEISRQQFLSFPVQLKFDRPSYNREKATTSKKEESHGLCVLLLRVVKFDAIVATVDAITAYKEETNIHGAHVNKKRGRLILFPVSQEFFQTNNFFPL
jgi:hypothetical protein